MKNESMALESKGFQCFFFIFILELFSGKSVDNI